MKQLKNSVGLFTLSLGIILINTNAIKIKKDTNDVDSTLIYVDCDAPKTNPKSMIGFLLSVSPNSPSSQYISPLNPQLWRQSSRNRNLLKRTVSFGAKPIFILSDVIKYPGAVRGEWKTPFLYPNNWKDTVKSVFAQHTSEGNIPIYDIWNEPNGKFFWAGTQNQYFNAFKNGYNQIRSMPNGNNALITGPSISNFDITFLQNFLDFCLENNLKLDVLSWHEFKSGNDIAKVADDVALAKSQFVKNPKYAALGIKSVQINEIIPQREQFAPGSILAYFSYLEKAGVDGACKACWPEANGKSNCFNNSLDGLLDQTTLQPRAAWWAYRYYNLSLKNRLRYTSSNSHLVGFANYQTNKIQLLIGYYGDKIKTPEFLNFKVSLKNIKSLPTFAAKNIVNVKVLSIPDSGESTLSEPKGYFQTTARILDDQINITIPRLYLREACVVEIK